jgi:hypothetical protein
MAVQPSELADIGAVAQLAEGAERGIGCLKKLCIWNIIKQNDGLFG